jgi:hypothetical protein
MLAYQATFTVFFSAEVRSSASMALMGDGKQCAALGGIGRSVVLPPSSPADENTAASHHHTSRCGVHREHSPELSEC